MNKLFCLTASMMLCFVAVKSQPNLVGKTVVAEWQFNKKGAVSITYDDGSYHQFTRALPIMEALKLPATFFVITGGIPGSRYHGKFVGRPVQEIISESASIPTNENNFLERCSAGGYLGYTNTISYVTKAASLYDEKKGEEAFKLMDELYAKVRHGDFKPGYQPCNEVLQENGLTWAELEKDAGKGYEIASHSITHASMPGLDSANIVYELEKSREDIKDKLGLKYTFSTEVPYGYENERVMKIAYKIYPALRNRMPEPWLKEIDRPSRQTPGSASKDYIQWQREMNTRAPLSLMKSWVDTTVSRKDTWLVLVIHGVDGLGYEALPSTLLKEYFTYISDHSRDLWVATFGDVTKYMREREALTINSRLEKNTILIHANHHLNAFFYNLPLTLKTYVPKFWREANLSAGTKITRLKILKDENGRYVNYQALPNNGLIKVSGR